MATYSLSSRSPDYSPEAAADAERSFVDSHPDVRVARAVLREVIGRAEPRLLRAVPEGEIVVDTFDAFADALEAAGELERAAADVARAERDALSQWRGHLALGYD